jgi:hypothetical protein
MKVIHRGLDINSLTDTREDRRRLDVFNASGEAVAFDDVKAWVSSWYSQNELPRPSARKIV